LRAISLLIVSDVCWILARRGRPYETPECPQRGMAAWRHSINIGSQRPTGCRPTG